MESEVLLRSSVPACQSYYDVKSQLQRYVYERSTEAFRAGDRRRDQISSRQELETYRAALRRRFIASLGGLPQDDVPLQPTVTGRLSQDGYTIEKVIFQSRKEVFVTASLYLPDGLDGPSGAVLFLCGHSLEGKQYERYQVVCLEMVRAGLVVLAQDPVGQGERFGYYEPGPDKSLMAGPTVEHDQGGTPCLLTGGYIPRYFIHDAMRSVDYLSQRPEVDPSRIGVTGSSGGGTQTCLMMICDPRIAAAAPTNFLTSRQTYQLAGGPQDAEQIWPAFTAMGYDHEDFLLAMAPRPVQVNAVRSDFFPIEGTRASVHRSARFWALYGREENLQLCEDDSTHKFTETLARKTAAFMARHLLGRSVPPDERPVTPLPDSCLWSTPDGQVRKALPSGRFIYEENLAVYQAVLNRRQALSAEEQQAQARDWLEEKVRSCRQNCDTNLRLQDPEQLKDLQVQSCLWWTQPGLMSHAFLIRSLTGPSGPLPLTLAVWDDGTFALRQHMPQIRSLCAAGRQVLVLDLSGVGHLQPHPLNERGVDQKFGTLFKLNDDLYWLDDSLAALRVFNILKTLDVLPLLPDCSQDGLELLLSGRFSLYGKIAAFLDQRIPKVLQEGRGWKLADLVTERYYDEEQVRSLIIPQMLRYADMPDLDRWLGGRLATI